MNLQVGFEVSGRFRVQKTRGRVDPWGAGCSDFMLLLAIGAVLFQVPSRIQNATQGVP